MNISYFGLYLDAVLSYIHRGVVGRAISSGIISFNAVSLSDHTHSTHRRVDDYPFSSRRGMLMRYDVLKRAVETVPSATLIMPDPSGERFDFRHAQRLSTHDHIAFISPAFEGVDARIFDEFSIQRYSLGDFILPNGDTPIMAMFEAIVRYIPGVVGRSDCVTDDSILLGLLEAPQFCPPRCVDKRAVPDVLLSGHHSKIQEWKQRQQLRRTLYHRPDLLNEFSFSESLVNIMDEIILEDTK